MWIALSRHPPPFVTHPFLKAAQSASVFKVFGASVQTFALQFQLAFDLQLDKYALQVSLLFAVETSLHTFGEHLEAPA